LLVIDLFGAIGKAGGYGLALSCQGVKQVDKLCGRGATL
jgi:hypothetical protein